MNIEWLLVRDHPFSESQRQPAKTTRGASFKDGDVELELPETTRIYTGKALNRQRKNVGKAAGLDRVLTARTQKQMCCFNNTFVVSFVTSNQFRRWLKEQGCSFERGKGGHETLRLGTKMSVLPRHGSSKELGTGLVQKIKKDLGLR